MAGTALNAAQRVQGAEACVVQRVGRVKLGMADGGWFRPHVFDGVSSSCTTWTNSTACMHGSMTAPYIKPCTAVCLALYLHSCRESPDPYIINSRGNCLNSLGRWSGAEGGAEQDQVQVVKK